MRAALRGLTLRGRCLVAAGLACVVCAVLLGERDLLRVGLLLLALPAVAVAALARTRYRLSCRRAVTPARAVPGAPVTVSLRLDNVSRLPTGLLLVEDAVPYLLGSRPRFVVDRLPSQGHCELTYQLHPPLRGRFRLGPLSVRLTDPFGLCELARSFATADTLVVTPPVQPLSPLRLGGDWAGGGSDRARAVTAHGEDDTAIREYRHGDDLRRVHWRSTARRGELMVRREEQPWRSRAAVLLDCRGGAHHGAGAASSFEWAVSAAASVCVHLTRLGYAVRLVTDGGQQLASGGDLTGATFEGAALDLLAVTTVSTNAGLAAGLTAVTAGAAEALVVAVVGELSPQDATGLARLHRGERTGVAVVLDSGSWVAASPAARAAAAAAYDERLKLLRGAGWRVLPAGHGAALPALWPAAGGRSTGPLRPEVPA